MTMKRKNATKASVNRPECGCAAGPTKLEVKKAGPNQGKHYWSCRTCGLFEWIYQRPKNWLESAAAKRVKAETAGCHCKSGPRRQQTQKEGANKGRWFLACNDCDFFQWDSPVVEQPIAAEVQPPAPPKSDFTITVPHDWDWSIPYRAMYTVY